MAGWVKLHRSLLNWQWYEDHNATRLLIHLLISVNYQDKQWRGHTIKAGSMAFSWDTLSVAVGLTIKQCRRAMEKLESGQEVGRQRAGNFQLVTLIKWEELQQLDTTEGRETGEERADKWQAKGSERATTKEVKNNKEGKEVKNIPPISEFLKYAKSKCKSNGLTYNENLTKLKYQAWQEAGWKSGIKQTPIKNWKVTLLNTLQYLQGNPQTAPIQNQSTSNKIPIG